MRRSRPIRRGDIWWVDFNPGRGTEQLGRRPALVIQANFITEEDFGSIVIVAMSTGAQGDDALRVTVEPSALNGLTKTGVVKCEQVLTVDARRLETYAGVLEPRYLEKVEQGLKVILGLR